MKPIIAIAHYILEYEKLVIYCNQIIINYYQLNKPPILAKNASIIPRSAIIKLKHEELYYSFHGIGCLCKLNNRIIDFDYCFGTFEYRGFQIYKLWKFIESDANKKRAFKNRQMFLNALLDLEAEGVIVRCPDNQVDTHEYVSNWKMLQELKVSDEVK